MKARMNEAVIIIHALSMADGLRLFSPLWCRKICGLFLLPPGLHLCVPHWNNCIQWCSWRFQENWMRGHRSLRWLALLPLCLVVTWCLFETLKFKYYIFLLLTDFLVCFQRTNTPRKQGGLGSMKIPLVSDTRHTISTDYGVLKEDEGIAYRLD